MKKNPMRQNERLCKTPVSHKGNLHASYNLISDGYTYGDDGVARKSTEIVEFDPVAHFSQFNALDFKLENIIAAGAVGALKEGVVNLGSGIECAEMADVAMDAIDFAINNNVKNGEE